MGELHPAIGLDTAAGYVTQDRKKLIDQDMAHFARWAGLLCVQPVGGLGEFQTGRATCW